MRGCKTAGGVFAILEGLAALFSGIGVAIMGTVLIDTLYDMLPISASDLPFEPKIFFIVIGAVVAVLGLIYFILGIKACRKSSGKGTGIALLIFSILMCNPLVFILSIVYLATRGKQDNSYGGGGGKDFGSDNTYV